MSIRHLAAGANYIPPGWLSPRQAADRMADVFGVPASRETMTKAAHRRRLHVEEAQRLAEAEGREPTAAELALRPDEVECLWIVLDEQNPAWGIFYYINSDSLANYEANDRDQDGQTRRGRGRPLGSKNRKRRKDGDGADDYGES